MNDDLYLTVEVMAGVDCRGAIHQLCSLSSHLRVPVETKMNGVTVRAFPYCDPKALADAWDAELTAPAKPFKYVSGKPFTLGRAAQQQPSGGGCP